MMQKVGIAILFIITVLLIVLNVNTIVLALYDCSSYFVTEQQIEEAESSGAINSLTVGGRVESDTLPTTDNHGLTNTYNPQQAGLNQ